MKCFIILERFVVKAATARSCNEKRENEPIDACSARAISAHRSVNFFLIGSGRASTVRLNWECSALGTPSPAENERCFAHFSSDQQGSTLTARDTHQIAAIADCFGILFCTFAGIRSFRARAETIARSKPQSCDGSG